MFAWVRGTPLTKSSKGIIMVGFILASAFVIIFGIAVVTTVGISPEIGGILGAFYIIGIVLMWHNHVFDPRNDATVYTEAKEKCEHLRGELIKTINKKDRYVCQITPTIVIPVD